MWEAESLLIWINEENRMKPSLSPHRPSLLIVLAMLSVTLVAVVGVGSLSNFFGAGFLFSGATPTGFALADTRVVKDADCYQLSRAVPSSQGVLQSLPQVLFDDFFDDSGSAAITIKIQDDIVWKNFYYPRLKLEKSGEVWLWDVGVWDGNDALQHIGVSEPPIGDQGNCQGGGAKGSCWLKGNAYSQLIKLNRNAFRTCRDPGSGRVGLFYPVVAYGSSNPFKWLVTLLELETGSPPPPPLLPAFMPFHLVEDSSQPKVTLPYLVGHWKFDGNSKDSSELKNNGISSIVTYSPRGVFGPAVEVGGPFRKFVFFGDVLDNVFAKQRPIFTISMWVEPKSISDSTTVLIGKFADRSVEDPPQTEWFLGHESSVYNGPFGVTFSWGRPGISRMVSTSSPVLKIGEWTHLVVSFNGEKSDDSAIHLFANGIEIPLKVTHSSGIFPSIENTNAGLSIGAAVDTGGRISNHHFEGSIDDVRVYKSLLAGSDVESLYHEGASSSNY